MSRKAFIFGLLVVVLLVAGLYRAKDGARESSAEIVRLETEIAEAYRRKRLLEADLAHMSRREWIEEYARKELGMGPARANQFATDYNLDLLIGSPEGRRIGEGTAAGQPNKGEQVEQAEAGQTQADNIVSVPVTDALNSLPEEDADPQ